MKSTNYKLFEELLETADIRLDGKRPWNLKIKDERVVSIGMIEHVCPLNYKDKNEDIVVEGISNKN